jgi:hypothetical protein
MRSAGRAACGPRGRDSAGAPNRALEASAVPAVPGCAPSEGFKLDQTGPFSFFSRSSLKWVFLRIILVLRVLWACKRGRHGPVQTGPVQFEMGRIEDLRFRILGEAKGPRKPTGERGQHRPADGNGGGWDESDETDEDGRAVERIRELAAPQQECPSGKAARDGAMA